jgi:hypothetical protein
MKKSIILICLISNAILVFSQKPRGYFHDDSVAIGKPIVFSLTYLHDSKSSLIFPDSNYNYQPFKLVGIDYFPTKTENGISLDSVTYQLVTFNIDSTFKFRLPVTNLSTKKKIFSDYVSVKLKSMIKEKDLKNPTIKKSTGFFSVPLDFNFPKVLYYFMIFLISGLIVWALFGKLMIRQFKIWLYKRKHKDFATNFKKLAKTPKNRENISSALVLWKNHMEWLQRRPFSSMTTSEITKALENERLEEALKEFDLAIYGGQVSEHIPFAFNILFDYITDTFKKQSKIYKEKLKS